MNTLKTLACITLASLAACGDSTEAQDARVKTKDAIQSIGTYTKTELGDMKANMRERWIALKGELSQLKEAAKAKGEKLSDGVRELIADVESQTEAAGEELESTTAESTAEVKSTMDHLEAAFDSAQKSAADAWTKLRK